MQKGQLLLSLVAYALLVGSLVLLGLRIYIPKKTDCDSLCEITLI